MKELDVVKLKDGRTATVLELFPDGAFLAEISDESGRALDMPIVQPEEVEEITYTA